MDFVESRQEQGGRTLVLKGEWTVLHAADIERTLDHGAVTDRRARAAQKPETPEKVDAGGIDKLDTTGAWLLRKYFPGMTLAGLSGAHQALLDFAPDRPSPPPGKKGPSDAAAFFIELGRGSAAAVDFSIAIMSFLGRVFTRLGVNLIHPSRFRLPSIARHIRETGIQALPIVSLLAFGISMVISYQGAIQLRKFGAEIITIDMTVISLLREMAVLVTAIMVAGRSGSAFAAEIGVMKMRGEVDALRTMGLDPVEVLVVPRLLALLFVLPLLSFVADIVGLAGGGVMAAVQLGLSPAAYIDRVRDIATPTMFFVGMIKAPVFALLITAVCTYQGMSATGSAEKVGKVTTMAVVQSIFLVIMADALFSIIFSQVDI